MLINILYDDSWSKDMFYYILYYIKYYICYIMEYICNCM